jgi:hypothetical protein
MRRKFIVWLSGLVAAFLAFFGLRWPSKVVPALPKPTKPPEPPILGDPYRTSPPAWEDLYAMMEDIVTHVDRTGETVRVADDPMLRRLGFACETKVWQINLTKVRGSLGTQPEKAELLRPYLATTAGRATIAAAMQASGMSRRNGRGLKQIAFAEALEASRDV